MISGRSLELFFVDGRPDGMLTAEVFNWTGHVLRIPRTRLHEGLKRTHARQTGVYILFGNDEEGDLAYIGEAEDMSERIKQHAKQKGWWEQALLITTTGDAFHKAHVKYLESRLVETALRAGHVRLENNNAPPRSSLNEAARANMESFLDTLHMVLPAIRMDAFQTGRVVTPDVVKKPEADGNGIHFHFSVPKSGGVANAELQSDEIIVKKGSSVRNKWVGSRSDKTHYWKLYDYLVNQGIIQLNGEKAVFTEDYAFSSPSAAAAIIAGRSANGRTSWKLRDGRTYEQWEADILLKDEQ